MKALIVGVALVLVGASAAPAHAASRGRECRFAGANGRRGLQRAEVKQTIRCFARHFDVSARTALRVARRESGLRPRARNPDGGYCGLYQHAPRYFPARRAAVPDRYRKLARSCFDGRTNTAAALWMVHRHGWGAWS